MKPAPPNKPLQSASSFVTIPYWALFALVFTLVFLVNMDVLRIVWQDWCDLPALSNLWASGWAGRWKIVTNEWIGQPRTFFLSWLVKAVLMQWFGLSAAPYFFMTLAAHLACSLLIYRLLRHATGLRDVAVAAGLLSLLTPTSAAPLFVTANAFYVLSFLFVVLYVYLFTFPLRRGLLDLGALSTVALTAQFSGEQTLPLLYLCFGIFGAWSLIKRRGPGLRYDLARVAVPAALCLITLAAYARAYVRPYSSGLPLRWSASATAAAFGQFAKFHADSLRFDSWVFGSMSVPVSWGTIWLSFLLLAVAAHPFKRASHEPPAGARLELSSIVALLTAGWLAMWVPVLAANLTGFRNVEFRHIYGTGILAAILIVVAVDWSMRRLAAAPVFRWPILLGLVSYAGCLMLYDLRDVWGAQADLDRRIWEAVDQRFSPQTEAVVIDGLQDATLMPINWSNAMSDFHEDFPLVGRIRAVHGKTVRIARRYREKDDHGAVVLLRGIHGGAWAAEKSKVLSIVFRYERQFFAMSRGRIHVFSDFAAYRAFRSAESFTFIE